jgi:hypothetical protein
MFGHGIIVSTLLFGLDLDFLFALDSIQGIALLVLLGLTLIIIGFVLKGVGGSIIAFAIGIVSFLYIRLRF